MKSECSDTTLLGSFMENHDNPRFPSLTSDISLAKNAIAFTMLADGIPIIYEGQEQHLNGGGVPNNREAIWLSGYSTSAVLYTHIKALNQIRSQAIKQNSAYVTTQAAVTYSDSSTIVTRKGSTGSQIVGVFSNKGANGNSYTLTLPSSDTSFTSNEQVVEVLSCTAYTTDSSGNLAVAMSGGLPRVFYSRSSLNGSGICPNLGKISVTCVVLRSGLLLLKPTLLHQDAVLAHLGSNSPLSVYTKSLLNANAYLRIRRWYTDFNSSNFLHRYSRDIRRKSDDNFWPNYKDSR